MELKICNTYLMAMICRLIEDGKRVKTWRLTGNLNQNLTGTIMHKTIPDIDMRTKVIHSFACHVVTIEVVVKLESITSQKVQLEH